MSALFISSPTEMAVTPYAIPIAATAVTKIPSRGFAYQLSKLRTSRVTAADVNAIPST